MRCKSLSAARSETINLSDVTITNANLRGLAIADVDLTDATADRIKLRDLLALRTQTHAT